jgi:ubiquinone/menaquinone biosynthesis C-methylase UbiE
MSPLVTGNDAASPNAVYDHQQGVSMDWKITQDMWGAAKAQALMAGVELDVFSAIHAGNSTSDMVAQAAGAPGASMRRLLDALVACGYLHKNGNNYCIDDEAVKFLVRGQAHYMGAAVQRLHAHWAAWGQLTEVIKCGRSPHNVNQMEHGGSFFADHVQAIFPSNLHAARNLVRSLPQTMLAQVRGIFDVGCGAGAWGIAFATALPEARVTALDFPEVIKIARTYARRFGVESQYEFIEGNFSTVEFVREGYDLVILGYVLHNEGIDRGRELIRRSCEALRPSGRLLIADMVADDDRTGPLIPMLFGLNMLVLTEHGDVFTEAEMQGALRHGGFATIKRLKSPSPSLFILAEK